MHLRPEVCRFEFAPVHLLHNAQGEIVESEPKRVPVGQEQRGCNVQVH